VFYGSAWEWSDIRQEFYLHQFVVEQPDLNFRNEAVVQAMQDVLIFWLDKGVDGFRIDAINHMFEIEDQRDEILTGWTSDPFDYGFTHHHYTKDLVSDN
jgi:alpha-glucosidase